MKSLILLALLLLGTGMMSYDNGAFHFSFSAAQVAYSNVKASLLQVSSK